MTFRAPTNVIVAVMPTLTTLSTFEEPVKTEISAAKAKIAFQGIALETICLEVLELVLRLRSRRRRLLALLV
jgi:hypothetical protein